MNRKLLTTLIALAAATALAQTGFAQGKGSGRQGSQARPQAPQGMDKARQTTEERAQERVSADRDVPGQAERERAEETLREQAGTMDDTDSDSDSDGDGQGKRAKAEKRDRLEGEGSGKSADKGSETAQQMRARAEERKAIQEQYRSEREPGQEGQMAREAEEGQQAKKPWWKFWGD